MRCRRSHQINVRPLRGIFWEFVCARSNKEQPNPSPSLSVCCDGRRESILVVENVIAVRVVPFVLGVVGEGVASVAAMLRPAVVSRYPRVANRGRRRLNRRTGATMVVGIDCRRIGSGRWGIERSAEFRSDLSPSASVSESSEPVVGAHAAALWIATSPFEDRAIRFHRTKCIWT